MNWAQENKFLTGYGIVILLGAGFLGYKVFAASSALDEANTKYTAKANTYNSLRQAAPFPSRQNLSAYENQKKEASDAIAAFQSQLAKREFPIEPMAPAEFQDRLLKAVKSVRANAAVQNVKLDDKFYLGFSRYETVPPDQDAAPILGRDLKAIEWVADQLVAAPILELKSINRTEIPEEKGKVATPSAGNVKPTPGAGNKAAVGKSKADLMRSDTFEIVFQTRQPQFAKVLNAIASPKAPHFYIVRTLRVANQEPKGPSRVGPAAAPGNPGEPADLKFIVGEEGIEVTLRLEIVDFAEPVASDSK